MAKPNRNLPKLTTQDIERFWLKVDKTQGQGPKGECWEFQGARVKGYGVFKVSRVADKIRRDVKAHRVAYFLETGNDFGEMLGCHKCDNPPCCRPAHLFEGTTRSNAEDAAEKGRLAKGDRNGSRLYPERLRKGDDHWTRTPQGRVRSGQHLTTVIRARGEKQHSAKMTESLVAEARTKHFNGTTTYRLAKEYGISWPAMHNLLNKITWKHI